MLAEFAPSSGARALGLAALRRLFEERRARAAAFGLGALLLVVLLGPAIYRTSPVALDLAVAGQGPSTSHPLGTDESGRDVLSRLLHGGRVSLAVGVLSVAFSLLLGLSLGALAGFRRSWLDHAIMRLTDAMLSIPTIFVVITALTFFGPTIPALVLTIGGTTWMGLARLVRGELLTIREHQYVEAARALGGRSLGLFARHMLPQLAPSVIVNATLGVGTAILTESALSFLGIGVQPPYASWGNMLSNAQTYVYSVPWLAAYPGILIFLAVVATNTLGDALRDVMEPRK
jgi:peptide/nickel transport system permease protein